MNTEEDVIIKLDSGETAAEFVLHYDVPFLWLRMGDSKEILAYRLQYAGIKRLDLLRFDGDLALFSSYPSFTTSLSHRRAAVIDQLKTIFPGLLEALGGTVLIDSYLLSRPEVVERYSWPRVLARRLDKVVVGVLREEFEVEAEGLTYAPVGGSNVLMLQLRNTSVRIDDLGDGARLATLMMMTVLASKPKLLLIEEPESRMHPRGLKVLTEALLKVTKSLDAQVVVSTHSLEFVRIGLEVAENLGISTSLIHLGRDADGTLTSRKLSKPDVDLLTDLGVDPRFLDLF